MGGLRVGLVCGHYDTARDGVADYTRQLAGHLRSAGVEPVICTAHPYARTADDGTVGVTGGWTAAGVLRAARQLARLHLDVVHVQFAPSAFGFSRAAGLLPRLLPAGTPVLATLHEYGVWSPGGIGGRLGSAMWSAVERRGYADRETLLLSLRADRVLVTASEHAGVLRARFLRRGLTPVHVPIGSNIAVARLGGGRSAGRTAFGLPPDADLVVFFGFLHPEKGLARLIEAVAQVHRVRPGIRLVLAGGVESHSVLGGAAAALRRDLERVARLHGIAHGVTFTGYLPEEDVSRLLQCADAVVLPFDAGVTGKSGSLLAALAHGVPTIATAPPGTATRAEEVGGVLRVPPRDTSALADALRLVLTDRALADRLAAAGRAHAARRTWPAIAAVHAGMYAEVLLDRTRWRTGRRSGGDSEPGRGLADSTRKGSAMSLAKRLTSKAGAAGDVAAG